jgi:hypothetical protein
MAKRPTQQPKKPANANQLDDPCRNVSANAEPPATPSYRVMHEEMARLEKDLTTILCLGKDASGDLEERSLGQVEAAVRELRNCRQMLICIQGHSPYKPPKKK